MCDNVRSNIFLNKEVKEMEKLFTDEYWELNTEIILLAEKYLNLARDGHVYEEVKAGWILGKRTIDAGRVYGVTVFRVKRWSHSNAAFWFVQSEYVYYSKLPLPKSEDGAVWHTVHEREMRLSALYAEFQEFEKRIKALSNT